jgi:hypothetical protein
MDISSIIFITIAAVTAAATYIEWRIRIVETRFLEKLADRDQINQVVQTELKADIARLEAKIDQLLQIQLQDYRDGRRKESN